MYFLGIDTSTTASKALLIDEQGEVIAVASSPHTLQTPQAALVGAGSARVVGGGVGEYPVGVGKSRYQRGAESQRSV